jgi:hypothetical protein
MQKARKKPRRRREATLDLGSSRRQKETVSLTDGPRSGNSIGFSWRET